MYENYAKIRDSKGLRDSDVSKGTGISSSVLSDWKKGRYSLKYDKLQKIAEFLGVTTDQLTGVQTNEQLGYYINSETADIAHQMFDDPQLRALHHIKKNIPYERFLAYYQMIKSLYKAENPDDNYDFDAGSKTDGSDDV